MPVPNTPTENHRAWLEPLLWSLGMVVAIVIAACVNETAREIALQGVAYLFAFFTTPFVLETSSAFVGLCIVLIINSRRIAREGDGWVVMEVKKPDAAENGAETQPNAD